MSWILFSWAFAAPPAAEALSYRLPPCDRDDQRATSKLLARTRAQDERDHLAYRDDLAERDAERLAIVRPLIAEGRVCTPQDHYDAAVILQRGPTAGDQLLAHVLAFHSVANGVKAGEKLTAVTYDRWLVSRGLPQWYGTQTRTDSQLRTCLIEVDPEAPDTQRVAAGLPRLADLVRRTQERNGREPMVEGLTGLRMNGLYCPAIPWNPEDAPSDPISALLPE